MFLFTRIFVSIFIVAFCCFNTLYALEPNTAYNGTAFIYHSDKPLSLSYDKKALHFISHPTQKDVFIAFVPIGYYDKKVKILKDGNKTALSITILQKDYKKEQIVVSQDKISYPNNIAKRIEKERNDMLKVYRTITKGRLWEKPFIKPLDSVITSPYGTARVFNGTLKSYHGGTDFRATIGTDVKASNDGKVALVQDRYLSGKTIVIDHGEGLYSVYFHLSDFEVKQGDTIKRGQIIAKSGDTGRVSGAHLHFGIIINGTNVDAMDFIEQVNTLFNM
ncbi:M23 family metallopeptidase [Helicobacter sp. MIT 21-1697]|uniref:M23 family metallopeptidase n=1 Tax=Helicobacter sp. MIT 21-1697 TaxID=2993733 RepID=UPI00224A94E3|nr:M23 family metallopeptidase [Helicobacter sp. MIT 21-1697]MCX2716565.1 M23 family metallopeptidase [Helicobacter sp. MIT 21-1697]